ncbi:hypothetical protein CsatB_018697 [Cannabis sativa]
MYPSMVILVQIIIIIIIFSFVFGECVHNHIHQLNVTCSEYERNALLDFKTGLIDPLNKLGSWNNGSSNNCCQWWGIGCNKAGAVITVDLRNRYHNSNLSGEIRPSLAKLESLRHLDLSNNSFKGIPIPVFFGFFKHLRYLSLYNAGFSGLCPPNIGNLSRLEYLDLDSSGLYVDNLEWITGLVSLKSLVMDGVDLSMGGLDWFEIILNKLPSLTELHMSHCNLSGPFPSISFVNSTTSLAVLDLSLNNFNSKIPDWLANLSSLVSLDLSFASLHGKIPLGFAELPNLQTFRLQLNGTLPEFLETTHDNCHSKSPLPSLEYLYLNNNELIGILPQWLGQLRNLSELDLSYNLLHGSIPKSLESLQNLSYLNFVENRLNGSLPDTLGQLSELSFLDVSSNQLTGNITETHFLKLRNLETLDLGNNRLAGNIPHWLGKSLKNLRILKLRSNAFFGELPSLLSNLSSLQVLDLADNGLNGSIPSSYGHFKGMIQVQRENFLLSYGSFIKYYEESMVLNVKGQELQYTRILSLVVSLDLSANNLSGELPSNLTTNLLGLMNLNLSNNHIRGSIPEDISNLGQLLSLDLSNNRLSGTIPNSLSSLSFLGHLNLSNNDLSGKIPYNGHMTTFEASSFASNQALCGEPLDVKCPSGNPVNNEDLMDHNDDDNFIDQWFFVSVGLGFAAGILVPFFMMAMKISWRETYFGFVEIVIERIPFFERRMRARRKWPRGLHH